MAQTNLKSKTGITVKSEIVVNLPEKINSWLNNIAKDSDIDSTKYKNAGELNAKVDELEHLLLKAMHAKGYYSAQIKSKIQLAQKHGERKVLFNIYPGELYILTEIRIDGEAKGIKVPEIQNLGLKLNTPLEAKKVLAAENIFRNHIESLNCLVTIDTSYQAVLDDENAEALLIFKVKPAPQAKFGAVEFKGLTTVDADFVSKKLKWKQGDCFKLNLIERTRSDLLATKFFGRVEVRYSEKPNSIGEIPITIEVTERLHKTIKVGMGYGSDEGLGGSTSWEHRNVGGEGETLKLDLAANKLKRKFDTTYTEPFFLRDDQSLILSSKLLDEDGTAYSALSWKFTGRAQRKLKNNWTASVGTGYTLSQVETAGASSENYGLLLFPLGLRQDTRDVVLDPKKGHQIILEWAPYVDTFNTNIIFYKSAAEGVKYYGFPDSKSYPVIAVRGVVGSIAGSSFYNIPADERFYAGGGGSVRGYGYQKLSEFSSGKALGGRSLVIVSTELRSHITEKIGGVLFVDGGNTYQEKYPDFNEPLRWAVGTGLRYYTGFGPIRFDIAFPIDPRPKIDSKYEFYISLGQAY